MKTGRIAEIDLLRGIAVAGMILYHFLFDLDFFGIAEFELHSGFWFWFARAAAFLFVFLAGLSCVLYAQRRKETHSLHRRGLLIFAWGLLITLITWILFPSYVIWFGALHLIGLGVFISPFFLHRMRIAAILGIFFLVFGILFSIGLIPFPPMVGIFPIVFPTFDYFPVFPWLGVFLLGMSAGMRVRSVAHSLLRARPFARSAIFSPFTWAGQNSLVIYLIHQPILLVLVWVWKFL